jgi:hypothetical protein
VLPKGKVVVSISHFRQGETVSDPEQGLDINGHSNATVLNFSHRLGDRTQIGLSLARSSGNIGFKIPGESFSIEQGGIYNASVRVDHIPGIVPPASLGISTSAELEW